MTTNNATQAMVNPAQNIIDKLTKESKFQDFKQMFKSSKEFDKFVRSFRLLTATNPDILQADQASLFMSLYKAGHDGLIVDGVKATITIFNTKVGNGKDERWVKNAVYMPMVKGIREKVFEFTGLLIDAQIVYDNDTFEWEQGDSPKLKHIPTLKGELGEPVAVYAIARKGNEVVDRTVLRIAEVEKVRLSSKSGVDKTDGKSPAGIWKNWWEEMAKKTAVRRLAKQLPLPEEVENIVNADNVLYDIKNNSSYLSENQYTQSLTNAFKGEPVPAKQEPQPNIIDGVDQSTGEVVEHSADDLNIITDIMNLFEHVKGSLKEENAAIYQSHIDSGFAGVSTDLLITMQKQLETFIK